jgi:hypothetical protein
LLQRKEKSQPMNWLGFFVQFKQAVKPYAAALLRD